MNEDQLLDQCFSLWENAKLDGGKDKMREDFRNLIDPAIARAAVKSDGRFTFATDIESVTLTDTNNKVEVFGNNDDCRDVYTVLWDTNEAVLRYYTEFERDVSFSGVAVSGAVGWTRRPTPEGDAPIIEIIGTVKSGDTLKFRYVRKDLVFSDWPTPWHYVLRDQILGQANSRFKAQAKLSLREMIDFYKSPARGSVQALPDPTTRAANYARSKKYIG